MSSPDPISVLIRTFNSSRTLEQVLRNLATAETDELIIVDSGSTDSTLAIAEKYDARIYSAAKPFNYSKALNQGFSAANADWVVVLSSHCIPVSGRYIPGIREVAVLLPPDVAVAYGPCVLARAAMSPCEQAPSFLNDEEWQRRKQRQGGNSNALYRRARWEEHPFDESLRNAEDLEWFLWALRNGHTVAQISELAVLYRNQGSLTRMFLKGFLDAGTSRRMLGSAQLSIAELCLGVGSYFKKTLLRQMPFSSFLRQSAQQVGVFFGSRRRD